MTKKSSKRNNKKNVSKVSKRKGSKVSKRKGSKVSKRKVSKRKGSKRKVSKKKDKRKRHKSSGKKTKKQKGSGVGGPTLIITQDPTITVRCHNIGVASQEIDYVKKIIVNTLYKKIIPQFKDPEKNNDTGGYKYDEIKPQAYLPNINSQGLKSYLHKLLTPGGNLFTYGGNNPNLLLLQEVFFEEDETLYKNYFKTFGTPDENAIVKKIHLKREGLESDEEKINVEKINVENLNEKDNKNVIGNNQYVRYPNGNHFQLVQIKSKSGQSEYKCLSSNLVIVFDKNRFNLLHFDVLSTKRAIICVLQDKALDIKLIVVNLQLRINVGEHFMINVSTIQDLTTKITKLKEEYSNAKIILGGDFNDDYFNPNVENKTLYEEHVQAFSNVLFDNYGEVRKRLQKLTLNLINVFQDNPQSTNYFSKPKKEGLLTDEKFIEQGKRIDFLFTDMESTNSEIDAKPTKLTTTENTNKPIENKNKAPNFSEPKKIGPKLRTLNPLLIQDPSSGEEIKADPLPLPLTDENFHQFGDHNALQAVLKNL